jgi:hypothetical protein
MALMRAVAIAKGTAEFAKLDDVVIFHMVNGQKMAALYNFKAVRRGNYNDPEVFANNVFVVGRFICETSVQRYFTGYPAVVKSDHSSANQIIDSAE